MSLGRPPVGAHIPADLVCLAHIPLGGMMPVGDSQGRDSTWFA